MQIHLSPRHLTLTAAIHAYVAEKMSHIEHLSAHVIAAHVVLLQDESKTGVKKFIAKVHLAVSGPDIYAEASRPDLYAAVDEVVAKITRMIRKRKTRMTIAKKHRSQLDSEERKRGYRRR